MVYTTMTPPAVRLIDKSITNCRLDDESTGPLITIRCSSNPRRHKTTAQHQKARIITSHITEVAF